MDGKHSVEKKQTIIIGGGQAGLAVGYYLAKSGIPFRILDSNPRVGDAWRNRWDSLRLFTTARYVGLPGFPFPARGDAFPTKDEMADYLESYAKRFDLPVENGVKVDRVIKTGDRFLITAGKQRFVADQVVIAMGNYQKPQTPEFAADLDPDIVQLHSHEYRSASQLREGPVLIVGAGNSGAEIAMEAVNTHETLMSGKETGHVPFRIESFIGRFLLVRLVRFVFHHILSMATPIGRKKRDALLHGKAPLVRVKPKDLVRAGVERTSRVVGVRDGRLLLADDRVLDVANVIWCTGYKPGFSWINLPIFDEEGLPKHERGIVASAPGLYFVGLHFLYALSSDNLMGIGRDAKYIADAIERSAEPAAPPRRRLSRSPVALPSSMS